MPKDHVDQKFMKERLCKKGCLKSASYVVRLSLDENVRAKENQKFMKERLCQKSLRLPSVSFPWSLAVHHQSLAITMRKTPEEEAGFK